MIKEKEKAVFLHEIDKCSKEIECEKFYFTNGFLLDGGEAGCGIIVVEGSNGETKVILGNDASSTQSEIFSFFVALKKIPNEENNAIIISDSQSIILLSINKSKVKCKLHQKLINRIHKMLYKIEKKNNKIVVMWVPSHIGIKANERADKAAKGAMKKEIYDDFGVSRDEYKRIISVFLQKERRK